MRLGIHEPKNNGMNTCMHAYMHAVDAGERGGEKNIEGHTDLCVSHAPVDTYSCICMHTCMHA